MSNGAAATLDNERRARRAVDNRVFGGPKLLCMTTADNAGGYDERPPQLLRIQAGSSLYLLDTSRSRVIRWTEDDSDRRRDDGRWMPVLTIVTCRLGEPLTLVLRGSDGLSRPLQSTWPVDSIGKVEPGDHAPYARGLDDPPTAADPLKGWAVTSQLVSHLTPASVGVWLVSTRSSRHIWDLDEMRYTRVPGEGSSRFDRDRAAVAISRVHRWPAVNETFLVWFDDPEYPAAIEHYRLSSTIRSIARLAKAPAAQVEGHGSGAPGTHGPGRRT